MAVRKGSGASLFLLEMLVAIVFFAISSAICVSLFVQARLMSQDSEDCTQALRLAQSAAECYKAGSGKLSSLENLFPQGAVEEAGFVAYFDDQWQPCDQQSARYRLCFSSEEKEKIQEGTVAVERLVRPVELMRLEVCSYGG